MRKLIAGIAEFRRNVQPSYRERFARLALGQAPDCLFFACSDSRVVPNLFASTDPGDLFVVRNVGNLVPPCGPDGLSETDRSEGAAIEFALESLHVRDVVVCGHSECGAMKVLVEGQDLTGAPNLGQWIEVGQRSLKRLETEPGFGVHLSPHNRLSQLNVLVQLEHLLGYPAVRARVEAGTLGLHGWWFDLSAAEVLSFAAERGRFEPIGATEQELAAFDEETGSEAG